MKNLRRVLSIILAVVMCLSLASCSMVDTEDTKITNDNIKIGVVIPGKTELGDGEFNDINSIVTINTIDKLTSFGYGISSDRFHYKDSVDPTNADAVKEAITSLINLECNLIFLADAGYQNYVADFANAEDNKDVKFVCQDLADGAQTENVFGYSNNTEDGAYLMGIVAGMKAAELKSAAGFIVEDENDVAELNSFSKGVLSVNATVKVTKVIASDNTAADVGELVKAGCKVIASDFYSEDIDNAANANKIFFCGYGVENYTDADYEGEESYFLCAPMFDFTQYYISVIKSIVDEQETTSYAGDFKLGSVYISGFGDGVANGTDKAVATAQTALAGGTLTTTPAVTNTAPLQ